MLCTSKISEPIVKIKKGLDKLSTLDASQLEDGAWDGPGQTSKFVYDNAA